MCHKIVRIVFDVIYQANCCRPLADSGISADWVSTASVSAIRHAPGIR